MSLPSSAPLDPSSDEARSWLRRELLDPEYHDQDLLGRLLRWLERALARGLDVAASAPPLSTLAAMVVLVLLAVGLGLLLSRARRTARAAAPAAVVLSEESVTAAELRRRAEAAVAQGRFADAVVDGFRALTLRQAERGRLEDAPSATAHEVAASLAAEYPAKRGEIALGAATFEAVLYGGRPATAGQADALLALDDELVGVR